MSKLSKETIKGLVMEVLGERKAIVSEGRVTKSDLQRIIKEEYERIISEGDNEELQRLQKIAKDLIAKLEQKNVPLPSFAKERVENPREYSGILGAPEADLSDLIGYLHYLDKETQQK